MRTKTIWILLAAVVLALAGCASDGTESDEYQDLEQELAAAEVQLADMTAEREELAAEATATAAASRYEKAQATQEAAFAIMADPWAFGTEDEVLDLFDEMAASGTVYGDAAFGSIGWRAGWKNTLFGQVDATIRTWTSWLSDDGSMGGSLWTWSGTARNGEPFDLHGIELSTYDENGLYTSVMVHYPFEDAEVMRIFNEGS